MLIKKKLHQIVEILDLHYPTQHLKQENSLDWVQSFCSFIRTWQVIDCILVSISTSYSFFQKLEIRNELLGKNLQRNLWKIACLKKVLMWESIYLSKIFETIRKVLRHSHRHKYLVQLSIAIFCRRNLIRSAPSSMDTLICYFFSLHYVRRLLDRFLLDEDRIRMDSINNPFYSRISPCCESLSHKFTERVDIVRRILVLRTLNVMLNFGQSVKWIFAQFGGVQVIGCISTLGAKDFASARFLYSTESDTWGIVGNSFCSYNPSWPGNNWFLGEHGQYEDTTPIETKLWFLFRIPPCHVKSARELKWNQWRHDADTLSSGSL